MTHMSKTGAGLTAGLAALLLGAMGAQAQSRVNGPDQALVTRVHELNQNEVTMAKMAEARARRADVKDFAATLIRDHRAADRNLLAYAERKNMNMAEVGRPGDAMAHGDLAMTDLTDAARNELDYTFANKMVADHQAAIDVVQNAQRLARDPELRTVLGDMLPTLRDHLASAQKLAASIPEPPSRTVQRPGEPSGVSRTHTGADERAGVTAKLATPAAPNAR